MVLRAFQARPNSPPALCRREYPLEVKMAAEKIGAETVTYVSNIYKYYIAYRLIVDDMARKQKATAVPRQEPVAQPAKPQPSVATAATAQVPVI